MSRWVDLTEIAEKWNLTVKEEGKNFPMGEGEVKKLEGLENVHKPGAPTQ